MRSPICISSIIAISIVAIAIQIYFPSEKGTLTDESKRRGDAEVIISKMDSDSDEDGLPDWIEGAYGTDIFNPDTDADGSKDGEEIVLGRNPLVSGPHDVIDKILSIASSTSPYEAKKLFLESFMGREARNIQTTVLNDMVEKFDPTKIQDRYTLQDLQVSFDLATSSIREYGNQINSILLKYSKIKTTPETTIIQRALQTNTPSELEKLQLIIVQYREITHDLRALKTPSNLAENHLLLVNAYDVMSRGLNLVQNLFNNPVEGAAGWQAYFSKNIFLADGYYGIMEKLLEYKIIYNKDEPGYFLQSKVK
jgi:hypothetical protein